MTIGTTVQITSTIVTITESEIYLFKTIDKETTLTKLKIIKIIDKE